MQTCSVIHEALDKGKFAIMAPAAQAKKYRGPGARPGERSWKERCLLKNPMHRKFCNPKKLQGRRSLPERPLTVDTQ